MIRGIIKNGLIYPAEALPPEWFEGLAVNIEATEPSDDPAAIEQWDAEMREAGVKYAPGEQEQLLKAIEEERRIGKEQMRREMGLDENGETH